jgi:histidyl-tRNA synthetase
LLELASLSSDHSQDEVLSGIEQLVAGSPQGEQGARDLRELLAAVRHGAPSLPADRVLVEPSIARGLDYYTGIVLETVLLDLPTIGSVASGGRYDNLAGQYTKEKLPGVGASLGLDRLLSALEELGRLPTSRTPAPVLLCMFDAARRNDYLRLAVQLRAAGIGVEVFPEAKKLGKQLQYADRQGFRAALIMGENEFAAGQCQVKNLADGSSATVPYTADNAAPLIAALRPLVET